LGGKWAFPSGSLGTRIMRDRGLGEGARLSQAGKPVPPGKECPLTSILSHGGERR